MSSSDAKVPKKALNQNVTTSTNGARMKQVASQNLNASDDEIENDKKVILKRNHVHMSEFVKFLVEQTKDVVLPLNIAKISTDFARNSGGRNSWKTFKNRVNSYRQTIFESNEFDGNTKVKMMYGLSTHLSPYILQELRKDANVEVDRKRRITKYEAYDGSLILGKQRNDATQCPTKPDNSRKNSSTDASDEGSEDTEAERKTEIKVNRSKKDDEKQSCKNKEKPSLYIPISASKQKNDVETKPKTRSIINSGSVIGGNKGVVVDNGDYKSKIFPDFDSIGVFDPDGMNHKVSVKRLEGGTPKKDSSNQAHFNLKSNRDHSSPHNSSFVLSGFRFSSKLIKKEEDPIIDNQEGRNAIMSFFSRGTPMLSAQNETAPPRSKSSMGARISRDMPNNSQKTRYRTKSEYRKEMEIDEDSKPSTSLSKARNTTDDFGDFDDFMAENGDCGARESSVEPIGVDLMTIRKSKMGKEITTEKGDLEFEGSQTSVYHKLANPDGPVNNEVEDSMDQLGVEAMGSQSMDEFQAVEHREGTVRKTEESMSRIRIDGPSISENVMKLVEDEASEERPSISDNDSTHGSREYIPAQFKMDVDDESDEEKRQKGYDKCWIHQNNEPIVDMDHAESGDSQNDDFNIDQFHNSHEFRDSSPIVSQKKQNVIDNQIMDVSENQEDHQNVQMQEPVQMEPEDVPNQQDAFLGLPSNSESWKLDDHQDCYLEDFDSTLNDTIDMDSYDMTVDSQGGSRNSDGIVQSLEFDRNAESESPHDHSESLMIGGDTENMEVLRQVGNIDQAPESTQLLLKSGESQKKQEVTPEAKSGNPTMSETQKSVSELDKSAPEIVQNLKINAKPKIAIPMKTPSSTQKPPHRRASRRGIDPSLIIYHNADGSGPSTSRKRSIRTPNRYSPPMKKFAPMKPESVSKSSKKMEKKGSVQQRGEQNGSKTTKTPVAKSIIAPTESKKASKVASLDTAVVIDVSVQTSKPAPTNGTVVTDEPGSIVATQDFEETLASSPTPPSMDFDNRAPIQSIVEPRGNLEMFGNKVSTSHGLNTVVASKTAPLNKTSITEIPKQYDPSPPISESSFLNADGSPPGTSKPALRNTTVVTPQENILESINAPPKSVTRPPPKRTPKKEPVEPEDIKPDIDRSAAAIQQPHMAEIDYKTLLIQLRGWIRLLDSPLLSELYGQIQTTLNGLGENKKTILVHKIMMPLRTLLFFGVHTAKSGENLQKNLKTFLAVLWNNITSFDIQELNEFGEEVKREIDKIEADGDKAVGIEGVRLVLDIIYKVAFD